MFYFVLFKQLSDVIYSPLKILNLHLVPLYENTVAFMEKLCQKNLCSRYLCSKSLHTILNYKIDERINFKGASFVVFHSEQSNIVKLILKLYFNCMC